MAHPGGLTEEEVRKAVVKDSIDRLHAELKRARPDLDASTVDAMAKEELLREITKLRLQAGAITAIKGPVVVTGGVPGGQVQVAATIADPVTVLLQFMIQERKERELREEKERKEREVREEKERKEREEREE